MSLVVSAVVRAWLDRAEQVLGTRVTVTSGDRTSAENAAAGGSPTSDHLHHLAADFLPHTSLATAYRAFKVPGAVPRFDQLIFYPVDGHIHVGLGTRMRGEFRVALKEGDYPLSTDVGQLARRAAPLVLLLVLVGLLYVAIQKGHA